MNDLRTKEMSLPFLSPLIIATDFEAPTVDLTIWKSVTVPSEYFGGDSIDPRSFNPGGCSREILINDHLIQSNALKNLGSSVALNG